MCVDSLLLKCNNDEKQHTHPTFISLFASDCILVPLKMVAACGSEWALRAGIGMTSNLPGQSMSVTQHFLTTNNCTILFRLLSTHLHCFQVIECDVYV